MKGGAEEKGDDGDAPDFFFAKDVLEAAPKVVDEGDVGEEVNPAAVEERVGEELPDIPVIQESVASESED